VCFILFFWSHLNSQVTWLALLLFLLGLVLLGLEIFVLPGFGVCGITGLVLTLGSLSLVAYGHWPTTSKEWASYGRGGLVPIFFSLVGAVACAFLLAKYLHHIPFINRLILKPRMESQEPEEHATSQAQQQLVGLLGAIGVAATPLRPAGKVQFGDQFVDVVAEGGSGYVEPGTRVQVIEIEGIRVVVKPV
jgi:membrane-bound ClpP family serine protease